MNVVCLIPIFKYLTFETVKDLTSPAQIQDN